MVRLNIPKVHVCFVVYYSLTCWNASLPLPSAGDRLLWKLDALSIVLCRWHWCRSPPIILYGRRWYHGRGRFTRRLSLESEPSWRSVGLQTTLSSMCAAGVRRQTIVILGMCGCAICSEFGFHFRRLQCYIAACHVCRFVVRFMCMPRR